MNKLALAVQGSDETKPAAAAKAPRPSTGQSHIRQARSSKPQAELPKTGPLADMLGKLFNKGD